MSFLPRSLASAADRLFVVVILNKQFFHQYYSKALSSAWGEKARAFYTTTSKQALDIHEEAKRISAEQKAASGTTPAAAAAPAPAAPTA